MVRVTIWAKINDQFSSVKSRLTQKSVQKAVLCAVLQGCVSNVNLHLRRLFCKLLDLSVGQCARMGHSKLELAAWPALLNALFVNHLTCAQHVVCQQRIHNQLCHLCLTLKVLTSWK